MGATFRPVLRVARATFRPVLRAVRAVLRAVVFLVVVGFLDFVVAIVFLRFCFDVAICPFSSAPSSNHASLFADLPSPMASQLLFYWKVEVNVAPRMPSSVSSPAAFYAPCAGARRSLLVVAIVDTLLVSGVANLGAETLNTRATRCACLTVKRQCLERV